MANRRMFSQKITNSGRFLKMPHESQALYFHLCLHADDDGVVEGLMVMRMTGANEDNLRVLVTKEFIKPLNDDMVSYIMDWNEHNKLRPDRKIDTVYKGILLQILPEVKLLRSKKRADTNKKTTKRIESATGLNTGRPLDGNWTDNGRPRVGKDRLGKDKELIPPKSPKGDGSVSKKSSISFLTEDTCQEIADQYGVNLKDVKDRREDLRIYCASKGKVYKDYYATLQGWVRRAMSDGKVKKLTADWSPPEITVLDSHTRERLAQEIRSNIRSKLFVNRIED